MPADLDWRPDPALDLVFERMVDAPRAALWRAWTTPALLEQWFAPAPWTTAACEIDLRPGGIFSTLVRAPDGREFPNLGCYLEVVPEERLAWTNALAPGFRPAPRPAKARAFHFAALVSFAALGPQTHYRALVRHADAESRQQHDSLGFQDGWAKACAQLVALARTL